MDCVLQSSKVSLYLWGCQLASLQDEATGADVQLSWLS